jgi:DNA-directed RNA polymerase I, II, and III subunit RPABC4
MRLMLCIGGRTKVGLHFYIISDDRILGTDLIEVEQDSASASEHQDVSLVVDEKEEDATHDLASDTDTSDSHSAASDSHSSHSSPTRDPSTQAPPPPHAQSTIRMTTNTAAHAHAFPTLAAPPPPHREVPLDPWTVYYDCAAGCLEPVKIRQGEPLICRNCGYRILYKRRTNRICYFEAR